MSIPNDITNGKVKGGIEHKWLVFASTATTTIMSTLDSSIVNIALPVIRAEFQAEIVVIEWVVISYLLIITALLMIFGRLADLYGRKKIYIIGIIIFMAGSALCAISNSVVTLIISRGIQGLGASCIMANGLAIITDVFPARERGKVLGLVGTTVAFGLSSGPIIGGVITSYLGWRFIFLINLPIGAVALYLASKFLVKSTRQKKAYFDLPGAVILAVSLIAMLLAFTKYQNWGTVAFITLLGTSVIFLAVFIRIESTASHPMVALSLFKDNRFAYANLAAFLNFTGRFSVVFLFPFYLVELRGMEPSTAGLLMTPVPLLIAIIAPYSGSLSDRIGTRILTTSGMLVTTAGFILFAFLKYDTSFIYMLTALVLMGIGSGLFGSPNTSTIMGSVPKIKLGIGAAMVSLVRNLGMIIGIAWSGALFHALSGAKEHLNSAEEFIPAFSTVMVIAIIFTFSAAVVSFKRAEMPIIHHYGKEKIYTHDSS